ncbi:MAG: sensor domain-containing diguanylate cyclase [Gammaproteobacteria bacterium]|nr:sensor domain-containing diguanylate cyclase [Gammaproteobacteria bacterium]MBU1775839.1 sensor domain-containing diguanylate cyclase [Gammaproteobacteria bacterium]MBU1968398.1 sensor domain-containing diguanylate cyclase [Gammaproteobacteria bacterium]
MQDLSALHTWVVNSLEEQIAVIDQSGTIIDVNDAWTDFGIENGLSSGTASIGANYFKVLSNSAVGGDALADEAAHGIRDVVDGKREVFQFEYPCHSPNEKRWFMMRVARLKNAQTALFVISHHNITLRKLAEERAEHLAMHDPLTGLANRRYFKLFLNREVRRSIRNRSEISLIELDVDYFKNYNDELGHPAGDQCLINVGHVLQELSRRPSDLAARLGGDEFALLLGDSDYAESQQVAEAILKAVADLGMTFGGAGQVTVSIGVASVDCDEQMDEDFLFLEADKALYRAKLEGRGRVVHVRHGKPDPS